MQTDLELELIERLKRKQVQQQQALQELQEAMALTSRSVPLPCPTVTICHTGVVGYLPYWVPAIL